MNQIAPTPQEKQAQRKRVVVGICVFFGVIILASLLSPKQPSPSRPEATTKNTVTRYELSDDVTNGLALLINTHGELCAKVERVTRLGDNRYDVTCTRYRDGTGQATYQVNMSTGEVK